MPEALPTPRLAVIDGEESTGGVLAEASAVLGPGEGVGDVVARGKPSVAKKLGQASHPFAKAGDRNSGLFSRPPISAAPLAALKAIDRMIVIGAQAGPKLLKEAVDAHRWPELCDIEGCLGDRKSRASPREPTRLTMTFQR